MLANPAKRAKGALDESGIAALARAASESHEVVERNLRAEIATLEAEARRCQTTIDAMTLGVCRFDDEGRLIVSNRRYREIYRLAPEQVRPGATAPEIVELRVAAGTSAIAGDADLALARSTHSPAASRTWTDELNDGRSIQVCHQPMPDGGWVETHEDVTGLEAKRDAATERLSLQTLIDWVPAILWIKDVKSRFIVANKASAAKIGRAGPEDLIGKVDFELHPPEIAQQYFDDEQRIIHSGQPMIEKEEYVIDASGVKTWITTTKAPLRNDRGEIFGLIGISRDITEHRLAAALRDGQAQILEMIAMGASLEDVLDRLVRLVDSQLTGISGSILLVDEDGTRLRLGAAPRLPEAYVKAVDGMPIGPNAGPSGRAAYRREPVIVADARTDPLWADYRDLAAANGLRSCWSTPILSHDGGVRGVFAMYSTEAREPSPVEMRLVDIATHMAGIAIERKLAEDRIRFMANHDALTGLANRALLNDRLSQALLRAQRCGRWATVAFVDLDNFKNINDSLGHNAGDELLKVVARRMVACVKATDTVVRVGGDEFVILLLDQPKSVENVATILQRIRTAIAEPVHLDGHTFRVTSSLGVANYPDDGTNAETLLANADAAVYRAKQVGRDNFQFYTPALNAKVREKFTLQEELRDAVARRQFVLHYQPLVDLRTGRVFAVEALIRWNHPTLGVLSPIKFISLAEETGLIVPIGDWVLHEACRQNKAWQDAGLPAMNVCVNVSARQFRDAQLIENVVSALGASGLAAKHLELELTESLIMQDVEQAVATMETLQGLGVQLSIDDFGIGYSSLGALKTFPVSRLKIDKSFIDDLADNEDDRAVASAVISLGKKLNLRVIAEGVETDEQLAFLRENHCDEMQGYRFSKPVAAKELEALLAAGAWPGAGASP